MKRDAETAADILRRNEGGFWTHLSRRKTNVFDVVTGDRARGMPQFSDGLRAASR